MNRSTTFPKGIAVFANLWTAEGFCSFSLDTALKTMGEYHLTSLQSMYTIVVSYKLTSRNEQEGS